MKVLLIDVALGMTPGAEWLGKYDANGGYLVVRKDGKIVCYHFYNRNDIEDYYITIQGLKEQVVADMVLVHFSEVKMEKYISN